MGLITGDLWQRNLFTGEMPEGTIDPLNPSKATSENEDRWIQLLDQNNSASEAEEMLKTLAKDDPAFREMYLQVLAERENEEDARRWYENFNNTYFQRTSKDLEAAGYSPWLMLQSLGSSGTGSLQSAGTWSGSSGTSSKVKREEIEAQNKQKGMTLAGTIIGAIIAAIALIAAA